MELKYIGAEEFEQFTSTESGVTFVLFTASWCGKF